MNEIDTLNEGKFTSASDGEMLPTEAVLAPNVAVNVSSRKWQALDVKVESNAKKTKTNEELSCDMDQGETSTSSTVTPDAETSKPIADMKKNDSVPMETDGFSLGISQNLYEQEQTNVSEQLPRRSKIEIPGQVCFGVPATQKSVSESHSDDIPKAAPTKATPAASDVIESSKTLNNQIQFDKVMIKTNQIRPSILTGLNALEKCYALFGEEIPFFMNADVENIKLKQIVEEFDDSLKVIKFHIEKKQSIEEKEPEGVRVVDVLHIFQIIYSPTLYFLNKVDLLNKF